MSRITPKITGPMQLFTAGIVLILLAYHFLTWQDFIGVINTDTVFEKLFCDFVIYYYPMGEAIFRSALPVEGFLYSPFIAILLAVFSPMGLSVSLVVWGILQVLFIVLLVLLFRRLVPAGPLIQLLFIFLVFSSFPLLLNFIGGQVSVFMIVALMGMLVFIKRGRRAAGAGLLALAVSFKFYPFIFLVPFTARRDTRFLFWAAVVCGAVLFAIPSIILGVNDTLRFYGALLNSFRESGWVAANPHSHYFPHVVVRLAEAAGHDLKATLPLLRWIAYGIAAVNMGLVFLVQRARLRHADLWSFQLVFLTIPFVLKTSWPHDFVFLSFSQALLAWLILEKKRAARGIDAEGNPYDTGTRLKRTFCLRAAIVFFFLLLSIVLSNIVFFNFFGNFYHYSFWGFLFWADLFLMIAFYMELLPPSLRRIRGLQADRVSQKYPAGGV
jgi:hypothetical protein